MYCYLSNIVVVLHGSSAEYMENIRKLTSTHFSDQQIVNMKIVLREIANAVVGLGKTTT